MSNIGQVFSRAELLKEIWPDEVVVLDRVVDVNITRIRQKNRSVRQEYSHTFRLRLWIHRIGSHIRSGFSFGCSVILYFSWGASSLSNTTVKKEFKADEMNTRLQMINTYILTVLEHGKTYRISVCAISIPSMT